MIDQVLKFFNSVFKPEPKKDGFEAIRNTEKFTPEYLSEFYRQNQKQGQHKNPFEGLTSEELNIVQARLGLSKNSSSKSPDQ